MNIQAISNNYMAAKTTGVTVLDGKKAERKEIYIRANARGFGAGEKQLVDSNTNKIAGITNLENKNMLPNGKNYLVLGLKISYAPVADTNVKTANYGNASGVPQFLNGELKIEQDGVLLNLPIKAVSVSSTNDNNYKESDQYYEVMPFMIKSGINFAITVECTDAVDVDQCFDLSLDVVEISTSAKVQSRGY